MRHRIAGNKLSRPTAHRMSMLRTAVTDFLRNETIQTTEAKAKGGAAAGRKGDNPGQGGHAA